MKKVLSDREAGKKMAKSYMGAAESSDDIFNFNANQYTKEKLSINVDDVDNVE